MLEYHASAKPSTLTPTTPFPHPLHAGCRLVYFLPAIADVYDPAEIPTHPMLRLIANCEQVLSTRYSRRLITMEKVRPYNAAEAAAFHEAAGPPRCGLEEGEREWTCVALLVTSFLNYACPFFPQNGGGRPARARVRSETGPRRRRGAVKHPSNRRSPAQYRCLAPAVCWH